MPADIVMFQRATPARRHRCEQCEKIFECHLCTIRRRHNLHRMPHDEYPSHGAFIAPETPIYICLPCSRELGYLYTQSGIIDYATGELIHRYRRGVHRVEWRRTLPLERTYALRQRQRDQTPR